MIGLILLIRLRSPGRDLPGLLDAASLTVVAAMLSWLYLIGPVARIDEPFIARLVSVAYPVLDLVLLVFSLRLILVPSSRPMSFVLLSTSLLAIFTADSVYVIQQLLNTYVSGNFLDAIWLAANLTLGAAALHPTMATLDQRRPGPDVRIGPVRLAILTTAALIAPTTLVLQDAFHALQDIPVIAAACAALVHLHHRPAGGSADRSAQAGQHRRTHRAAHPALRRGAAARCPGPRGEVGRDADRAGDRRRPLQLDQRPLRAPGR